jgi:hypothetical protein
MSDAPTTPQEYLDAVPAECRELIDAIRGTILDHLPDGFEETIEFKMLSYVVPLERFADTYNGRPLPVLSLANQKQYVSLYLMGIYADEGERDWFVDAWEQTGKKLDMGRSCVRFRRLDDVPLGVVGEAVARVSVDDIIVAHERAHGRG